MATYRIYQDRNAWRLGDARQCAAFNGDLTGAKAEAVKLRFTHVEAVDGRTVHLVAGVWRKA